jgi:NTE family protein
MRALVLSGGGLFGAWQAGAWSVLADRIQPDLIVGASVGSLNGYAIAAGAGTEKLFDLWRDPKHASFGDLHTNLRELTRHPLRRPFAIAVTDLLRLKPRLYRDSEVTWRHLAASCAIPCVLPQMKLDGRWYGDGGLLNALPLWAAAELGATEILGLHVMQVFPSRWVRPFWHAFRWGFGYFPTLPEGVRTSILAPSEELGSMTDAVRWKKANIERWIELGKADARAAATQKSFPF